MPDKLFSPFKKYVYIYMCTDFDTLLQPERGECYVSFPSCRVTIATSQQFPE
jgi:hypothetical protein